MSDQEKTAYRVLARKYRPSTFTDLIGQAPMVQTLTNAFQMGRIAQAYMLTGVRGVGKTTTARILARALNYELAAGDDHEAVDMPTIDMPQIGIHCDAIIESRHVDVIEMDAASHTSINDIREIIEASRYKPATARYKVYIIDEVHMLSTAAFNGLLKTLEEPPAHVKFIFATTEIRKVPVTVLSRCQRFDLRRIDADTMIHFLTGIADLEKVSIADDAKRLIARASEGSVRDALSLLDQAIAHGATGGAAGGSNEIGEDALRDMLGLADSARIIDLFELLMSGKIAEALAELNEQYNSGADPMVVLSDLAEFTHLLTRLKVAPGVQDQGALSPREKERGTELAAKLSMRVLSSTWQILLKGIQEVANAPTPLAAADMVLVRLAYAADLPSPDEALRQLKQAQQSGAAPAAPNAPVSGNSSGGPSGAQSAKSMASAVGSQYTGGASSGGSHLSAVAMAPRAEIHAAPQVVSDVQPDDQPAVTLETLEDIMALASERRDMPLRFAVERQLRLVSFQQGHIEVALAPNAPKTIAGDLGKKLSEWTGRRWLVSIVQDGGTPTLHEQATHARETEFLETERHPLVAAALKAFPGSKLVDVVKQNRVLQPPENSDPENSGPENSDKE
ncbi:MAG: DNA polymerase III subunit gamma/tau [Hyphomicrobiales bacterium]|nr:MAG: DNA polymerase III subunit gamma/tau [Hyphomicrobiales bacterium]